MTIEAMKAVWHAKVGSPTQKAVLGILANFANQEDEAYPSIATIRQYTEFGERAVRQALRDLEAAGWIERRDRFYKNGIQASSTYWLRFMTEGAPTLPPSSGDEGEETDATQGRQELPGGGGSRCQGGVAADAPNPLDNPGSDPLVTQDAPAALPAWGEFQRVRQQPLFTAPEPPTPEKPKRQSKAAANAALDVPALVDTWNRICGPTMGTVQFVSDVRRKALLARMMEFFENDPAKWEAYCRKMSRSRFLTGQKTDFRATFDWSLAPRNVPKVLEGQYNQTPEERGEPRPVASPYAGYNPHLRPGDPDWRPSPGTI